MTEGSRPSRIGVDAGGTFVDLVAVDGESERARSTKVPSDARLGGALRAANGLAPTRPDAVVAGTTRVTNAILEGRLARTVLVTTEGFRDVLAIGRQARDDLYDLGRPARAAPVVPRELRLEVRERMGADGGVLVALEAPELDRVAAAVRASGAEAVAVCLLNAWANAEHEARLAEALGELPALALSHRVSRERREYERSSTTALNAAVLPTIARYLDDQEAAVRSLFPGTPSFVVHSAGGMMTVERAAALPLATVMSGPAAGIAATARLARRLKLDRAVAVDMGGTSTDVCFLRGGVAAAARDRTLAGHAVRLPAVAVESIGAGGGSVAAVDDVGALRVGPRSAGAEPGPAAYGRGGSEATVTDACVVLGVAGNWGGALALHREPAEEACGRLGSLLGLSAPEAGRAVLEVAHAAMDGALRLVTVRRGEDLRSCTLVAYGGAGPMHAGAVALAAGVDQVVVPALSSTFSALGCCLAELAVDDVRTFLAPLEGSGWPSVEASLADLVRDLQRELGEASGTVRALRSLELRYRGQNDALEVVLDEGASVQAVADAFHERHRGEYGYATDEPVEVTALRARLWVDEGTGWAAPEARAGDLEIGETAFGPVLARGALEPGLRVDGPAVLADELSTVVVWPGLRATADGDANVWLERAR